MNSVIDMEVVLGKPSTPVVIHLYPPTTNHPPTKEYVVAHKMRYTREDLLKGRAMEPGWYPCECTGHEETLSKEDKSTNWNFKLIVLDGTTEQQSGKDVGGTPLYRLFNEKGMGFADKFIEVVTGHPPNEEGGEFDPDEAKGKKMLVYVKNETYNGRLVNRVEDFRPIG